METGFYFGNFTTLLPYFYSFLREILLPIFIDFLNVILNIFEITVTWLEPVVFVLKLWKLSMVKI